MAALATLPDFEVRYGRELDGDEVARALALLDDASALIRDVAGDDFDTVPATVLFVVCEVVRRAFDNPAGLQGETIGDYSWRTGYTGVSRSASSGVYLTDEEKSIVRRAAGTLSVVTLTMTSALPLPALAPEVAPYLNDQGVVVVNFAETDYL